MNLSLDTLSHIGEALIILVVGWRVLHRLERIGNVLIDFPPHRHTNGKLLYPRGFSPGQTGQITNEPH